MGSNLKELADAACRGQTLHQTKPTIQKGSKQQIKKSERERENWESRKKTFANGQISWDLHWSIWMWSPLHCRQSPALANGLSHQTVQKASRIQSFDGCWPHTWSVCLFAWCALAKKGQPDPTRSNQISHRSNQCQVLTDLHPAYATDASEAACHVAG